MSFNYAGPGAVVGIQGENITITGGIVVGSETIAVGDVTVDGEDD